MDAGKGASRLSVPGRRALLLIAAIVVILLVLLGAMISGLTTLAWNRSLELRYPVEPAPPVFPDARTGEDVADDAPGPR